MNTTKKFYKVDRKEISFLRFIFEAYDGIALLSTVDSVKGILAFYIAPGCEEDVDMVIKDLKKNITIENYELKK